jgi:hypothetical protein
MSSRSQRASTSKYVDSPEDSLLFPPAMKGCHLDDRVLGKEILAPVTKSLDLQGITHHSLRHSAGTRTGEVASLAETKQRLRHSTTKASELYQHAASSSAQRVAERLSAAALAELNGAAQASSD